MRIAILADIHSNLPALEAVLADLKEQSPDAVYLAGDQINRCPWNNEVLDLLDTLKWPTIQGNHELVIGAINTPANRPPFTNRERFIDLWWTQEHLRPEHLTSIRQLPTEMHLTFDGAPPIHLVHGIPGNPFIGVLPETTDAALHDMMATVTESIIICAHTHRPLARQVGRWQIYNGGSIGAPYNGDPRAQYLLLDTANGQWQPTFRQVDYDRSPIPVAFRESGLLAATGALGELHLRTIQDGQPWSSDFAFWMHSQSTELHNDLHRAIALYLTQHGPGHWAFTNL